MPQDGWEQDAVFLPPEAFGSSMNMDSASLAADFSALNAWDIATRYHEFKVALSKQGRAEALRRISAKAILDRARQILGSVAHPSDPRTSAWDDLPAYADRLELDLEETLENSPAQVISLARKSGIPLLPADVWMSYSVPRSHPVILAVDTSLSMTGEKLALTAVALAVVLLQFPEDPVGIVAFENEGTVLKEPEERISIQILLERFLDVPAQGYTHLEDGLLKALRLVRQVKSRGRRPSTVLLTDGKYTAGRDPAYLASRFPHLVVVKMGRERASEPLCVELAKKGQGHLEEVAQLEALPSVMSEVVRSLIRGRSLAGSFEQG
jgi:uncharacterized protein YegL